MEIIIRNIMTKEIIREYLYITFLIDLSNQAERNVMCQDKPN